MSSQKEMHQLELMQTIFGVISKRDLSIDQQLAEILKAGCKLFREEIGIVSRINGDSYTVEHIYAPGFDIQKGQQFDLADTFCSITIASNKALSISDVKNSEHRIHPCTAMGIESYIGMSITVNGQKFGTLNFSSMSPHDQKFLDTDLEFMRTLCDWIGNALGYAQLVDKLSTQASQDSLTELPNRTAIIKKIERCLERHNIDKNYNFAVLFVDLDKFKQVNDNLGHQVGDELLKQVAQRLQGVVRPRDSIGRYGGDEFVVLLEDVKQEQADLTAQRIKDVLSTSYTINGHKIDVSASVGVAVNDGIANTQELINHADKLMYEEKKKKLVVS